MSKDILSTIDDLKLQTEDDKVEKIEHYRTNKANDTSEGLSVETVDKTPISSATPVNESHKNEDGDPLLLVNESIETTKPTEGFNETECVKFGEKLHKIVEELRIGRISDKENELRIQKLMSEKNELERLKDDEALKKQELIQEHNMKEDDIRKKFDDKLRSFQEEKTKHVLERQSGEQEIKALKDEIRSLHINKYSMEKIIKDQERQIQNHGTSNTNYLTQMAKVENQCKDIFKQCSQVLATVDKVEANINSSSKLNKKLSFMNDHQKCTVLTYKERYEKTKQELITVQAGVVSSSVKEEDGGNIKESTLHLEDELRMQKELCQQVQVQLNNSTEEIQGLLKSLDNAHSLLAKHVETNNKYAESELMLQLELDDLRTDCEKYKDELTAHKADVEEKDVKINELKNTIKEKEEQEGKLEKEKENLEKEKQSLEELNSTWSQTIVEQKDEIESMKNKQVEMEALMEETKKKLDVKSMEVETLEEKLKAEASRHQELLQKACEEKAQNNSETQKWRDRTTELLQSEEKLKAELDKVKKENKMKDPQNQYTQTEITDKTDKETSTITILNFKSTMLDKCTTTEDTTPEIQHGEDETKSQHVILQSHVDKLPKMSGISTDKEAVLETKAKSAADNHDDLCLQIQPQNAPITTCSNNTALPKHSTSTHEKPNKTGVTDLHQIQASKSKEATKTSLFAHDVGFSSYNQTPGMVNTVAKGVLSTEGGEDTVLSSQEADGVSQSTLAQSKHAASKIAFQNNEFTPSKNPTQQGKTSAAQSGSTIKPIYSASNLEENTKSQSEDLSVASQHCTTSSLIADSDIQNQRTPKAQSIFEGKPAKIMRGIPENILGSKSQEKRKPLLAVVKPSSVGALPQSKENKSSLPADSQPSTSQVICAATDNNATSEVTSHLLTSVRNATSSQPCSQSLTSSQTCFHVPSQSPQCRSQPPSKTRFQTPYQKPTPSDAPNQTSFRASTQARSQPPTEAVKQPFAQDLTSNFANPEAQRADISEGNSDDGKYSENAIAVQQSIATNPSLTSTSDQEMMQQVSETRVLRPRAIDLSQTISSRKSTNKISGPSQNPEKAIKESDAPPEKCNFAQDKRSKKKQERKSEDFCFSDEEDESIPRAIGSQVDRIETFLKNERLRLSKKRKAVDE